MTSKLLRTAIVSSPILALYGIFPIYLFVSVDLLRLLPAFIGLTIAILVIWAINIFITRKEQIPWRRYLLSYSATTLLYFLTQQVAHTAIQEKSVGLLLYPWLAILAINTVILIIINAMEFRHRKEMAELEIKSLKILNLEAEKTVLLQQLQPHFLFNALSTLKSLIGENAAEAENYAVKLSEFLRYSISPTTRELVSLEEELQFTNDYLMLQKMRFGRSISASINIPADYHQKRIPPFALQTLVENAIKHNRYTDKNPLSIVVTAANNAVFVENNKVLKELTKLSGTGLKNLDKRYKLLTGRQIIIEETQDKFTVQLALF